MEKDLIIIGGGPGGYIAAIRAAQLGAGVALIEQDKLGGTCLNRGCIPTKSFFRSAQMANDLEKSSDFGILMDGFSIDMSKINLRKQQIVERLVGGIGQLLKGNKVEVIKGKAYIKDKNTVRVTGSTGECTEISGRNILIATGSIPSKPPIPGLELPGVMNSNEILEINKIPSNLVIIGGGVIGIEFAGIFNALGSKVTVIEYLPKILSNFDAEISKKMALALKRQGISFETGVEVNEIIKIENGLSVLCEGKKGSLCFQTENVLVAAGRNINVSGLNLDSIGIEYDRKGIKVDCRYETNVPGIYAIGDVIGGQMLAHVASDEGKAAVENMLGFKGSINYDSIPSCVFSFPEAAAVGLTEEEAGERGIKYLTGKFLFGANGKALTMGEEEGFVKVLSEHDTGRILGVHIMGPHASDLIHEAALAVENELTINNIIKTTHAHPTLAEAFAEAVMGIDNRAIHMAPRRQV